MLVMASLFLQYIRICMSIDKCFAATSLGTHYFHISSVAMHPLNTSLYLFLVFSITVTSSALPTTSPVPLPPSQDPWYTAPDDFESTSPGTILRLRTAPGNLTTTFSNSSAAYNILFRTTNSHYVPSWAVTTLFVPKNASGNVLLSYQIPYNTVNLDASPSYLLYTPPSPSSELINSDIETVSEQMGRNFLCSFGTLEGRSSLCSIEEIFVPSRRRLTHIRICSRPSAWAGTLPFQISKVL